MGDESTNRAEILEGTSLLEARVRELEERLEHFSAATTEGVFLHEAGVIREVNRAGAAMFGYEPEELVGCDVLDLTSPEDRPRTRASFAAGGELHLELTGERKDGTRFPMEIRARSLALGSRTIRAVTVSDRTAHRGAELELRESRERYRSILANLRGIAYRVTANGFRPLFLGGSVLEITGRTAEEILDGRLRWREIVHPEDRDRVGWGKAAVSSGAAKSVDLTYRIVRADGSLRWVRDTGRAARLGSQELIEGLVVDVTAEMEIQDELRRTRDLLVRSEELAGIGSWSWDVGTMEVSWSPGMYRHYGVSPEEVKSPIELTMSSLLPEDLPRVREHFRGAAAKGRLEPIEYRLRVGDRIRYHRTEGEVHRNAETGSVRMVGFVRDVTELTLAEEERRRAEQERDRLFDLSLDLLAVAKFDGHFKQLNPAWNRALGWTVEELLSRPWIDFVHPDDRDATVAVTERLRAGESVTGFENRYQHRDGSFRWFSWNIRALPDTSLIFAVARDVTDEKIARQALESEVSFRNSIVKGAAEGLAVCHEIPEFPYVAFTVWNDRMTGITGYSMEEINRLGWYQTVYPDPEIREKARERMARMRQGDDLRGEEWVITRKDGETRVLRFSTSVLWAPDDQPHVLALMEDVTEGRRAEEALRASEERYRSLFEGAPYGIFRSTPDGTLVAVNRALGAMLGVAPEDLQGTNLREVYQDPCEWTAMVREAHTCERIGSLEVNWRKKDGTPITVRLSGRPLHAADGLLLGFEMVAEDVTERRLLEEQFRQAQKMEAVGRLAGGIAHDFNNLLTAITGYADLLRARIPPEDPKSAYVEEIGAAADRASSLTRQLLAFSRRQLLQPRVLNLEEIVRNVERMLGRIIGEDVELETCLLARGRVRADASQLEQVLVNLAVNARDAMPHGGKLRIETRDCELNEARELDRRHRASMPPGSYVLLEVSDTGVGIDRDSLSHIFEPFYTTKEPGKGTGLGLATVYGIVKQSEGFIWVSSEPGRGTCFEIYLPRIAAEAALGVAAAVPEIASGSETILLVEDEDVVRRIASEMLEWYGYTVLQAKSSEEAVEIARTHPGPIHLLLTDVVMPRLGGRALRERIEPYRPRIAVLYMSGYAGRDATEELLQGGAAFLSKPFTAAALAGKVRLVLRTAGTGASDALVGPLG